MKVKYCAGIAFKHLGLITIALWVFAAAVSAQQQELSPSFRLPPAEDTGYIDKLLRNAGNLVELDPARGEVLFREVLQKSRLIRDAGRTADALAGIGRALTFMNRFGEASEVFTEALKYAYLSPHRTRQLLYIYGNIGWMYAVEGQYETAAQYLFRLASYAGTYMRPGQKASLYTNICGIFASMPEHLLAESLKQALYYSNQAERYALQMNEEGKPDILSTIWLNRGHIYMRAGEWEQSSRYLDKAMQMARQANRPETIHNILLTRGELYLAMDRPERALPYVREAGSISSVNPYYKVQEAFVLGRVYMELKEYELAAASLIQAKARAHKGHPSIPEIESVLADVYARQGAHQPALEAHRRSVHLRDSTFSRKHSESIHRLETQYRTVQKDKELALQQLRINRQQRELDKKNLIVAGSITGTLVLFVLLLILYRNYRHRQQFQRARIRNLQQEQDLLQQGKEIDLLKAMISGEEKERQRISRELHDGIGGMLAAINMHFSVAHKKYGQFENMQELVQIMHMVEETSGEVRKTAHNLLPSILLNSNLKQALEHYCRQVSLENKLHIDIHVQELKICLQKSQEITLFRIIQELIQNIIRHAHATHAVIEIDHDETHLHIIVEDNGIGFNADSEQYGFGLQNLQFRMRSLRGDIRIDSRSREGTSVMLRFALDNLHNQATP